MRMSKRALALALALITMLALAAPALAAEEQMYATTGLNVRKGPGTSYAIVGELAKGDVVTVTSRTGNWAYITYDGGAKGYASLSYLKAYTGSGTSSGTVAAGTTMYITSAVNVRSGPGTSYSKVGELAKGDKVIRVGTTGSWSIIEWKNGTAYVSSGYLTPTNPNAGSSGSATGSIKLQATTGVNIRKGPGTGYAIVGVLNKGDTIYGTGVTSGTWTQVAYKGEIAYVASSSLRTVSGSTSSSGKTMYCTTNNTKVYDRASTSSIVRGYLDKGQAVQVLSQDGYWAAIQYSNGVAYVRTYYLSGEEYSVSAKTGVVYATSSVRVRSGPGSSYSSLGYLYSGESAERTGTSGSWTQINYKGKTGYVPTSQVKAITLSSMKSYNAYMYATNARTYAYSIPNSSSAYRQGYYHRNEPVYVIAYNSSWAQVDQDGTILYVQRSNLSEKEPSYSSSYPSWMYDVDWVWVPAGTKYYRYSFDITDKEAKPEGYTYKGQYLYVLNDYGRELRLADDDRDLVGWFDVYDIYPSNDYYWFHH